MRHTPKVFGKRWFELHQAVLLWWANTLIGRLVLGIPLREERVRKITPELHAASHDGIHYHATVFQGKQYANRLYFALRPFWMLLHNLDTFLARTGLNYNFGFDSLTLYSPDGANAYTGNVYRNGVNETLATIRAGAGVDYWPHGAPGVLVNLSASATSNQYSMLLRSITTFKLGSLLPANGKATSVTVSAATVSIYGASKINTLGSSELAIVAATPASNTAAAVADYGQTGTTQLADNITYANFSTTGYNAFSLNAAGIASIDLTLTHARFGFRLEWDRANSFGGVWGSGKQAGFNINSQADKYPKIDLTYTVRAAPSLTGAGFGPASVGYVGGGATVGGDAVTSQRLQVSASSSFSAPLVDVTATVNISSGSPFGVTGAWANPAAGTYYARVGVENSYYNPIWSDTITFEVAVPTIDSISISQSAEHVTVTVGITDSYSHPPLVTVFIDGHAVVAEVTDRVPDAYVYVATMDVSLGQHSLQVQCNNIWAVVTSDLQYFTASYDLHESSVKVYWGDRQVKAWGFQWVDPLLPDVPSCTFSSDEEITGQVQVILRRRGYESRTYKVTRHSKQGSSWSMTCDAVEKSALNTILDLQVRGVTANDLMQQAMGNVAPAADYSLLMPQWFYGQTYNCRASELIDQLVIQSGVMAWLQAGRWAAASIDAPATAPLAWSKREPQVGYEADDTVFNRVRAHYAIAQYPVPATALTEKDAANWTGTITDVALTDNLLPAPSGAWYMLRTNGNVSRAGLSISLAPFDRFRLNWLPETATSLAIKLKQDDSNYLSYTRTFAGGTGSGFIATGSGPSGTAVYTVTATIRPVLIQGYMSQSCSVVVVLKKSGATVLTLDSVQTVGAENHWQVSIPASIYQADTITTIEMTFSGLYPVNSGYGVSCTQLLIDEYKQVATVTGTTRQINYRATLSCSMPVQSHDTYSNYEEWGFAGILGKVPTLGANEQWDLLTVGGSINCKIYDYTAVGGLRSVAKDVPVYITILGDDIWVGSHIATDPGYAGADGQIASVTGGHASAVLIKYEVASTSTLSWVIARYGWASTYNLWDAIDIPLTSFVPTGTTRTVTSIELTCANINELDALQLAASNPLDQVVEAVTGAGDILYPDEATGFNSREAAQAWADGMLARVSVARPSYTKTLPLNEDIALGEWVNCDGTPLQVRAIQGDMDSSTITVAAGADQQTLAATLHAQTKALDELKRRVWRYQY